MRQLILGIVVGSAVTRTVAGANEEVMGDA